LKKTVFKDIEEREKDVKGCSLGFMKKSQLLRKIESREKRTATIGRAGKKKPHRAYGREKKRLISKVVKGRKVGGKGENSVKLQDGREEKSGALD